MENLAEDGVHRLAVLDALSELLGKAVHLVVAADRPGREGVRRLDGPTPHLEGLHAVYLAGMVWSVRVLAVSFRVMRKRCPSNSTWHGTKRGQNEMNASSSTSSSDRPGADMMALESGSPGACDESILGTMGSDWDYFGIAQVARERLQ